MKWKNDPLGFAHTLYPERSRDENPFNLRIFCGDYLYMRRLIDIFTAYFAEITMYIHELDEWPEFFWVSEDLLPLLALVRSKQGHILGKLQVYGFDIQNITNLDVITREILNSSSIEGEDLEGEQVRSSVARKLGMELGGLIPSDSKVDGIVEMMIDATQNHDKPLTKERLCSWNSYLFPMVNNSISTIVTGAWRDDAKGPMEVVSGTIGRIKVHFQAPPAKKVENEMQLFLDWVNSNNDIDSILKSAIAHLWFITIHPFEDGNGRIARAVSDMLLARSDNQSYRCYSMSSQIKKERKAYYDILEKSQKGTLDITPWLMWFLKCLLNAIENSNSILEIIAKKQSFWMKNAQIPFNERQIKILNLLLDDFEGVLHTSKWAKLTKCSQDTALRDIQDLITKNILVKSLKSGRSTTYELL